MNKFEYVNASSVQSAGAQLTNDWSVRVKAGGIDLLDELKERIIAPRRLVNIKTVPNINEIKTNADGSVTIGALVTLARVHADKTLQAKYFALSEAAGGAATPQIRNVASIGGNLAQRPRCWYYRSEDFACLKKGGDSCFAQEGDNRFHAIFGNSRCAIVHPSATAVALVALNAKVKLVSLKGDRIIPLEQFFASPETDIKRENVLRADEIITEILLPPLSANTRSYYIKQKEKQSFDWPIADAAVVLEINQGKCSAARIVLGSAAPIPWRVPNAERLLVGRAIDDSSARTAAKIALEGAKPMTHNGYKVPLLEAIVTRTILAAAQKA